MIEKEFYSYSIDEKGVHHPYQIWIFEHECADIETTTYETVGLRYGKCITIHQYDNAFLRRLFDIDPIEVSKFLDYHLDSYHGDPNDFVKKIEQHFCDGNLNNLRTFFENEDYGYEHDHDHIEKHIFETRNWIEAKHRQATPRAKLIWSGTPSQFGFIFRELAEKGFIKLPDYRGQINSKESAKIFWELFDLETCQSLENLEKEFRKSNLTPYYKELFKFPNLSDMA